MFFFIFIAMITRQKLNTNAFAYQHSPCIPVLCLLFSSSNAIHIFLNLALFSSCGKKSTNVVFIYFFCIAHYQLQENNVT
jgi:hypothetical protein